MKMIIQTPLLRIRDRSDSKREDIDARIHKKKEALTDYVRYISKKFMKMDGFHCGRDTDSTIGNALLQDHLSGPQCIEDLSLLVSSTSNDDGHFDLSELEPLQPFLFQNEPSAQVQFVPNNLQNQSFESSDTTELVPLSHCHSSYDFTTNTQSTSCEFTSSHSGSCQYDTIKTESPKHSCQQLPPFSKWVNKYLGQKSDNYAETNLSQYQSSFPYQSYVPDQAFECLTDESHVMCRKGKRGAKNILLWKFILDQLRMENNDIIKWVDRSSGTFRFVDTLEISKKWGERKKKTDMNFEKLSRGIRHYYKSGFMSREDGTRLVYKFHWSKVPRDWRPPEVQKLYDWRRH